MARSPKRHAVMMDEHNWPLTDAPPRLTLSPSSSQESVDRLVPLTPEMGTSDRESYLLPGFHFSTDDEAVDVAEFHRAAAQLLSGEEAKPDTDEDDEERPASGQTLKHLHCGLGKDLSGRHCCSCGKSYSTGLRLNEHIQKCAGINNYPCHTCDKIFTSQEARSRHITIKHNDDKEPCPECGIEFPSTYLPKHLAAGLGGCDSTVQATFTPQLDRDFTAPHSPSQRYWVIDGDHSWKKKRAHDSGYGADETDEVADQTLSFVTRLLQRPASHTDKVFCDLCGEGFAARGEALAQHIGQHSMDFSEKRHRCDDCRIFFANEKDLQRHLQSANLTRHCGFTFRHNSSCTGHHPPTYSKSAIANDHTLMQKHLWAWELSQFRTHRVAVATILAQTLNRTADPHMSLSDCKRTYASMLPHFVAANRDSARSCWSTSKHESVDVASLDAHFSRIIDDIDAQRALTAAQLEFNDMYSDRPDSGVILQATRISFHRHRRAGSNNSSNSQNHLSPVSPTVMGKEERPISFRKSILEMTLRKSASDENKNSSSFNGSNNANSNNINSNNNNNINITGVKKVATHKRYALSASGFALLKQRAEVDIRPSSAPGPNNIAVAAAS